MTIKAIPFGLNEIICEQFRDGMTDAELAAKHGYSRNQIRSLRVRLGLVLTREQTVERQRNRIVGRVPKPRPPTARDLKPFLIRDVARAASSITKIPLDTLLHGRRGKYHCRVRAAVYHICMRHYSYPQIGRVFGGRDHSTIIYGCDVAAGLLHSSETYRQLVESIERQARSSGEQVRIGITECLQVAA